MVSHIIIKDTPAYAKASAGKGHPGATGWPAFFPSAFEKSKRCMKRD